MILFTAEHVNRSQIRVFRATSDKKRVAEVLTLKQAKKLERNFMHKREPDSKGYQGCQKRALKVDAIIF